MSALQVEFPITPDRLPQAEDALFALGCQAISLISDTDEPVLEPAPGETPMWEQVTLRAWFPLELDFAALREGLQTEFADLEIRIDFVGQQDPQQQLNNFAVEQVFANRLHLMPKAHRGAVLPAGQLGLYLDPGLAFGSGSHPTTALCLDWLAHNVVTDDLHILDFGCGSGILSVAAALLGAQVTAVDHDPQAVVATRENAAYNAVLDQCTVLSLDQWQQQFSQDQAMVRDTYDVVVANILAQPLMQLASTFEQVCKPGASIVLSGILQEQVAEVIQAYADTRFSEPVNQQEWVRLHGICSSNS